MFGKKVLFAFCCLTMFGKSHAADETLSIPSDIAVILEPFVECDPIEQAVLRDTYKLVVPQGSLDPDDFKAAINIFVMHRSSLKEFLQSHLSDKITRGGETEILVAREGICKPEEEAESIKQYEMFDDDTLISLDKTVQVVPSPEREILVLPKEGITPVQEMKSAFEALYLELSAKLKENEFEFLKGTEQNVAFLKQGYEKLTASLNDPVRNLRDYCIPEGIQ